METSQLAPLFCTLAGITSLKQVTVVAHPIPQLFHSLRDPDPWLPTQFTLNFPDVAHEDRLIARSPISILRWYDGLLRQATQDGRKFSQIESVLLIPPPTL